MPAPSRPPISLRASQCRSLVNTPNERADRYLMDRGRQPQLSLSFNTHPSMLIDILTSFPEGCGTGAAYRNKRDTMG